MLRAVPQRTHGPIDLTNSENGLGRPRLAKEAIGVSPLGGGVHAWTPLAQSTALFKSSMKLTTHTPAGAAAYELASVGMLLWMATRTSPIVMTAMAAATTRRATVIGFMGHRQYIRGATSTGAPVRVQSVVEMRSETPAVVAAVVGASSSGSVGV